MPISNSYPKGIPIEDQDLFVGTKAYNNRTVNYTAQGVADYLNINSKVAIGGQMSFQFTVVPNIPKTIAFNGGNGNNTAFSAITKLIVSAIDLSTANITIFLNYLNNSQVLLSQQNQPNFFGHYKITGYTQIGTSAFYELDLEFIGGNGTISDKQYYDLVSFVLSAETSPTEWGTITGDIEDQTDLIDYISSQITTPTLQSVTDEGNTITDGIYTATLNQNGLSVDNGFGNVFFGWDNYNISNFTDGSNIFNLNITGFNFANISNADSARIDINGLNVASPESDTSYGANSFARQDKTTTNLITINYPSSIIGTDKVQTFQDADGTIALTSDIGTWGTLNYPTWTTGTPFVKMTAAGTFSLDTNNYAIDSNVVHKTGDETITGIKTFYNIGFFTNVVLENPNTAATSSALLINAFNGGMGIKSENISTGIGIYSNGTGTGLNYVGANNGATTFSVNKTGDVTANSFIKTGGTSSQYLMADGSVTTGGITSVTATSPITSSGGATPVISTSMATNKLIGRSTAGTGVMEEITIGTGLTLSGGTLNGSATGVTSVGLTMPSAFTVTNSPITSSGDIAVTGAGLVSQYVRGDGTLANFPNSTGGGSSVNYYLNGSVSQGTFGGDTYYEMSKTPILGAGTNFTRTNGAGNGYIASFITDAGDPSFLNIPGGNWNLEFYFQSSATGGSPQFYGEIYKVSATNVFTLVASGSANPEGITNGTTVDQYFTSISVPQTSLLITDRLAVRIYVITGGRTITLHTENGNLCEVLTTFTTGLTALNGLTDQVQFFDVGTGATNFNISSSGDTHTFNLLFNIRRNANNSSNNNINYNGYAVTGSSESSAVWTITRLTIAASGSITVATATNVAWTDRESVIY